MSASLAVVPHSRESSQPDAAWIKKHVPVLDVGRALGMRIRRRCANCWRPDNHTHGDADPSLHFYVRGNRVRCFICDMRGGHSNIDLVMGVLGIEFGDAVRWIAERFSVPNVKPGRPVGAPSKLQPQYRVGTSGLEIETLIRSGLFGQLAPPEGRILLALCFFRDTETGWTRMSYRALMRYAGVGSPRSVSLALSHLQRIHALQKNRRPRFGIIRDCSSYRVTLEDERFLQLCNEVYRNVRDEGQRERAIRLELRVAREKQLAERHFSKRSRAKIEKPSLPAADTCKGGLRPPAPPAALFSPERENQGPHPTPSTCEGLNLSSHREAQANKSLPLVKREISEAEWQRRIQEQKARLNAWLHQRSANERA